MTELNKAMRRNWRQSLLFKNELPEKEDVTLCEKRLILRYN